MPDMTFQEFYHTEKKKHYKKLLLTCSEEWLGSKHVVEIRPGEPLKDARCTWRDVYNSRMFYHGLMLQTRHFDG